MPGPSVIKLAQQFVRDVPWTTNSFKKGYETMRKSIETAAEKLAKILSLQSKREGGDVANIIFEGMHLKWDKMKARNNRLYKNAFDALPNKGEGVIAVPNNLLKLKNELVRYSESLGDLGKEKVGQAIKEIESAIKLAKENRDDLVIKGQISPEDIGGIPMKSLWSLQSVVRQKIDEIKGLNPADFTISPYLDAFGNTQMGPLLQVRNAFLEDIHAGMQTGIARYPLATTEAIVDVPGRAMLPEKYLGQATVKSAWTSEEKNKAQRLFNLARKSTRVMKKEFEEPLSEFLFKLDKMPAWHKLDAGNKEGSLALKQIFKGLPPEHRLMVSASIVDRLGRMTPQSGDLTVYSPDFSLERFVQGYRGIVDSSKDIMFGPKTGDSLRAKYRRDLDTFAETIEKITTFTPSDEAQISKKALANIVAALPLLGIALPAIKKYTYAGETLGTDDELGMSQLLGFGAITLSSPILARKALTNPKFTGWLVKEIPEYFASQLAKTRAAGIDPTQQLSRLLLRLGAQKVGRREGPRVLDEDYTPYYATDERQPRGSEKGQPQVIKRAGISVPSIHSPEFLDSLKKAGIERPFSILLNYLKLTSDLIMPDEESEMDLVETGVDDAGDLYALYAQMGFMKESTLPKEYAGAALKLTSPHLFGIKTRLENRPQDVEKIKKAVIPQYVRHPE